MKRFIESPINWHEVISHVEKCASDLEDIQDRIDNGEDANIIDKSEKVSLVISEIFYYLLQLLEVSGTDNRYEVSRTYALESLKWISEWNINFQELKHQKCRC